MEIEKFLKKFLAWFSRQSGTKIEKFLENDTDFEDRMEFRTVWIFAGTEIEKFLGTIFEAKCGTKIEKFLKSWAWFSRQSVARKSRNF